MTEENRKEDEKILNIARKAQHSLSSVESTETLKVAKALLDAQLLSANSTETLKVAKALVDAQFLSANSIETLKSARELFKAQFSSMNSSLMSLASSPVFESVRAVQASRDSMFREYARYQASYYQNFYHSSELLKAISHEFPSYMIKIDEQNQSVPILEDSTSKQIPFNNTLPNTFSVLDVINSITHEDIQNFYNHLSKYPMLGLTHKVGQKILQTLQDKNKAENYTEYNQISLYRARIREQELDRPYTEAEMFNPPFGISEQGRGNPHGISVLYTCSTKDGAIAEVKGENNVKIDVIQWNLKLPVKFLDLTNQKSPFLNYCQFEVGSQLQNEPAYLIPNFLVQCCQLANIEGIAFNSTKAENSVNYIFFDHQKKWFEYITLFAEC